IDPGDATVKSPKDVYYARRATWEITAYIAKDAQPGATSVSLSTSKIFVCDDDNCFPAAPKDIPEPKLEILSGKPKPIPQAVQSEVQSALGKGLTTVAQKPTVTPPGLSSGEAPPTVAFKQKQLSLTEYEASIERVRAQIKSSPVEVRKGLAGFLLTAALWGL